MEPSLKDLVYNGRDVLHKIVDTVPTVTLILQHCMIDQLSCDICVHCVQCGSCNMTDYSAVLTYYGLVLGSRLGKKYER